jgi:hypothetical protein
MDGVTRFPQLVREGEEARRLSLRVMEEEHGGHHRYPIRSI